MQPGWMLPAASIQHREQRPEPGPAPRTGAAHPRAVQHPLHPGWTLPTPRPAPSPGTSNRDHHTGDEPHASRVGAPEAGSQHRDQPAAVGQLPGGLPRRRPLPAASPGPASRAEPGRARVPRLGPALRRGTWLSAGMAPPPGSPGPRRHRPPRRAEPCRAVPRGRGERGGGRARQAGRCSPGPPDGACGTCRRRAGPPACAHSSTGISGIYPRAQPGTHPGTSAPPSPVSSIGIPGTQPPGFTPVPTRLIGSPLNTPGTQCDTQLGTIPVPTRRTGISEHRHPGSHPPLSIPVSTRRAGNSRHRLWYPPRDAPQCIDTPQFPPRSHPSTHRAPTLTTHREPTPAPGRPFSLQRTNPARSRTRDRGDAGHLGVRTAAETHLRAEIIKPPFPLCKPPGTGERGKQHKGALCL